MIEFPNEESKWLWLTGIIDCDAYIGLMKVKEHRVRTLRRGFRWVPAMKFQQSNLDFLTEIKTISNAGNISPARQKRGNIHWRCSLHATQLRILLPKIIPFLIKKRRQAELVLKAVTLLKQHRPYHTPYDADLEKIRSELHSLNEKGKHKEVFEK
jgi:hypothetical protein